MDFYINAGLTANSYVNQIYADTGYSLKEQMDAIDDRERETDRQTETETERERERERSDFVLSARLDNDIICLCGQILIAWLSTYERKILVLYIFSMIFFILFF